MKTTRTLLLLFQLDIEAERAEFLHENIKEFRDAASKLSSPRTIAS